MTDVRVPRWLAVCLWVGIPLQLVLFCRIWRDTASFENHVHRLRDNLALTTLPYEVPDTNVHRKPRLRQDGVLINFLAEAVVLGRTPGLALSDGQMAAAVRLVAAQQDGCKRMLVTDDALARDFDRLDGVLNARQRGYLDAHDVDVARRKRQILESPGGTILADFLARFEGPR